MSEPMTAPQILDREFLEIRAKILELAASFDRMDRGDGAVENDMRMKTIRKGVEILQTDAPNRAEQLQLLFSREYEADWRTQFDIE